MRTLIFFLFLLGQESFFAQISYGFTLTTTKDICLKGNAVIEISGIEPADNLSILWSNGTANTKEVNDLIVGAYSINIIIKHTKDSLILTKDTTLYFSIEKELCGVTVDKYFSPNDDNYHDLMGVSNTVYHPNFELNIFNKWGQQVHSQKKTYVPWDGKWNGIDLPDGTYFYVFFYDASQKTKLIKGDVTILR